MKIGYVYKIVSPNNRIYIGSTNNIIKRKNDYSNLHCKNQRILHSSFLKYGVENHNIEVIWFGSINEMYQKERLYGDYFNVLDKHKGMNCKLPGYDDIPGVMTNETKLKIGLGNKNKVRSAETKEKLRIINTGNKHSDFSKKKISISGYKRVICKETGIIFESLIKASEYAGISPNNLSRYLNNTRKNKTTLKLYNG